MICAPPLAEYGIQTDQSDIRAHVSVVNRCVFVFPTKAGLEAVEKNNAKLVFAGQEGVSGKTSSGWLVKPEWIRGLRAVRDDSFEWHLFSQNMSTSRKGEIAVDAVRHLMAKGDFPVTLNGIPISDKQMQISGTDLLICPELKVQVKCDYRAGPPPGTGNLYLQKAECNPRKMY
jgi:hypothetical protein